MCEGGYGEGVRNVIGIGEKQIIQVSNNRVFNMKLPLFRWISACRVRLGRVRGRPK